MKKTEKLPKKFDEIIVGMGKSGYIPGIIPINFLLEINIGILNKSVELLIDLDNKRMLIPNPSSMLPKVIPADQVYEKLIWRLFGFRNRIAFYNFIIDLEKKKLIRDYEI